MMKIKISGLKEGIHQFEYNGDIQSIKLGEPFTGNFELNVSIDKLSHQLLLKAAGAADAGFVCDRCGKNFTQKIAFNFSTVYLFGQSPLSNSDMASDNIVYMAPDQDSINIQPELYDFATLSLPMKVLCKEDCKGLCIKCGTDLNEQQCDCSNDAEGERNNSPFKDLKNLINN